jgi:hypothetical protein
VVATKTAVSQKCTDQSPCVLVIEQRHMRLRDYDKIGHFSKTCAFDGDPAVVLTGQDCRKKMSPFIQLNRAVVERISANGPP